MELNKKGELTTKQLVTIIVLIASFIIILFLIFRLNLGGTTDKEICRNSVILNGKSAIGSGPIDCRTNYLCVSGGSNCETISQTSETNINADNKTQIMKALADEMSECWWQFGEGKINYGGSWTDTNVKYALCSIIAFDEKVGEKTPSISYQEFYSYLQTTKKTNSQTYLQYLYSTNIPNGIKDGEYFNFSLSDSIDTSKKYSVITGIDMNLKILKIGNDDRILGVFILPTEETSSRLVEDREFITKT